MADKHQKVVGIRQLYHATTLDQVDNIVRQGVNPLCQKPGSRLDFGPGFYTTSQNAQAREFALMKQDVRGGLAAILEYDLPPDFWEDLTGVEFDLRGNATWKKFVMGFRSGSVAAVDDGVDYVYGPVADNLKLMKTAGKLPTPIRPSGRGYYDQISFHSGEAVRRLNDLMKKGGCYLWVWSNDTWTRRRLIRS